MGAQSGRSWRYILRMCGVQRRYIVYSRDTPFLHTLSDVLIIISPLPIFPSSYRPTPLLQGSLTRIPDISPQARPHNLPKFPTQSQKSKKAMAPSRLQPLVHFAPSVMTFHSFPLSVTYPIRFSVTVFASSTIELGIF